MRENVFSGGGGLVMGKKGEGTKKGEEGGGQIGREGGRREKGEVFALFGF